MELDAYVDEIRRLVEVAADAGRDDARAAAERLIAPLDAAVRLAVQHALADAAEEITCEMAPGSVELRVRGRELAFAVTLPAVDDAPPADAVALDAAPEDDGGMARINVRMPESLKSRVEQAAGAQRVSVNAWLVRAAGAALKHADAPRPNARRTARGTQQYRGWTR
jgi:hypothetical protein